MKGLYILITNALEKNNTIKFGMSMRLEYRWIDYLDVFSDSKYIYYYEILDDLNRSEILELETEIIINHIEFRNNDYQTEYFNCDAKILHLSIIKLLDYLELRYNIYTEHMFDKNKYDYKRENISNNIKINTISKYKNIFNNINIIEPKTYQQEVLDTIDEFYKNNNIGKIIWSCGLGKTLLSIFIVKKLNCKLIIVGVPDIKLQHQFADEILLIFHDYSNILFVGGVNNNTILSTNNIENINNFCSKKTNGPKFIISTYSSCHLLLDITPIDGNIDFKIGDEAHHLVNINYETKNKSYSIFHKINSNKTLFLTATEKIIENENILKYSMDNIKVFGLCIDYKSIYWAIENKKITDYNLLIIKNTEQELNYIIDKLNLKCIVENNELFLSAFMALKSIQQIDELNHILIYTNTIYNSELIEKYINMILDTKIFNISNNYYNKALHSGNVTNIIEEKNEFISKDWGIISSVYMFSEGFNCPELYGVVFAENMDSEIRIVQCALRPNRLDKKNNNKIGYVIIPYLDTPDNNSYEKIRKIISKIRNVDENIEYRINVSMINILPVLDESNKNIINNALHLLDAGCNYIDNPEELNKIKIKLIYSGALYNNLSEEQNYYNYIKLLNKELSIKSKEEYTFDYIKNKHSFYIDNPEEYFKIKGIWIDWFDFLNINTTNFIKTKNDWIVFCKKNNISSLSDYDILCDENIDLIPRNPSEYYSNFSNILNELKINKKIRK